MTHFSGSNADAMVPPSRRVDAAALLRRLARIGELVLAVVLLWAGIAKLIEPGDARRALFAVGLPLWSLTPLAYTAAFTDVLLGCLLAANGLRRAWPAAVTAFVLVGYTGFLVVLMNTSDAPACGCFGAADPATHEHATYLPVLRNVGLMALCGLAGYAAWGGWGGRDRR